nr:8472_t:CDS:2 [Entrophospora candida]
MEDTINITKSIPKMLALTGRLNFGGLFKLRMNVNLISNVLDTPEIFWSEPLLQPLYNAIRTYLEISQRVKVLNDRCNVINDLLAVFVAMGEIAVKLFL